ncbi:hypothetical protein CORC01_04873 [Colletotrichum orchidophilum]|uniref:Secreted protein n=1 Tax=Colletotrichum orchidophilum TaxID=1209926 RepID=A0A1G4BEG4_9PEZI|nr:uncharacterized protein CORC01_04873 [Colletotrichum orchidophilum]OHE99737.1 hypothetical protein CORC01_04873 [Colletotrichum orchidophilum]
MRVDLAALVAAIATSCIADYLVVHTRCTSWDPKSCERTDSWFYLNGGRASVNGNHGCRSVPIVRFMQDMCLDYDSGRGHFQFEHQHRRCMALSPKRHTLRCPPGFFTCWRSQWDEATCPREES